MKKTVTLLLGVTTLLLAGCSATQVATKTGSQRATIESVFAQRGKLKAKIEPASLMSDQRVEELMAIDVQRCPADFRSAWFDYLITVQSLHTKAKRVALIASAEGKPVADLPSLIKFAVTNPVLGQYLLDAVNKDDVAWEKVERSAMNFGVLPYHGGSAK